MVFLTNAPLAAQAQPKAGKVAPEKKSKPEEAKEGEEKDAAKADAAPEVAANEPASDVPGAYWVLELEEKALRMIAPREGIGTGEVYWYLLYTLTNTGKEDRDVYVSVTATSDNNKLYADLFQPSIEKAIERKENLLLWGKSDEFALLSKRKPSDPRYHYVTLKAGDIRRCVAVFNRLDPNANKITIRVAGLSNEIKEIKKDDGTRLLEERVRELYYERLGDEHAITLDSFTLVGKDWVKKQTPAPGSAGESAPGESPTGLPRGAPAEDAQEPAGEAPEK